MSLPSIGGTQDLGALWVTFNSAILNAFLCSSSDGAIVVACLFFLAAATLKSDFQGRRKLSLSLVPSLVFIAENHIPTYRCCCCCRGASGARSSGGRWTEFFFILFGQGVVYSSLGTLHSFDVASGTFFHVHPGHTPQTDLKRKALAIGHTTTEKLNSHNLFQVR